MTCPTGFASAPRPVRPLQRSLCGPPHPTGSGGAARSSSAALNPGSWAATASAESEVVIRGASCLRCPSPRLKAGACARSEAPDSSGRETAHISRTPQPLEPGLSFDQRHNLRLDFTPLNRTAPTGHREPFSETAFPSKDLTRPQIRSASSGDKRLVSRFRSRRQPSH